MTEQKRLSETCMALRRDRERQAQFHNIVTRSMRMKAIFRAVTGTSPEAPKAFVYDTRPGNVRKSG